MPAINVLPPDVQITSLSGAGTPAPPAPATGTPGSSTFGSVLSNAVSAPTGRDSHPEPASPPKTDADPTRPGADQAASRAGQFVDGQVDHNPGPASADDLPSRSELSNVPASSESLVQPHATAGGTKVKSAGPPPPADT